MMKHVREESLAGSISYQLSRPVKTIKHISRNFLLKYMDPRFGQPTDHNDSCPLWSSRLTAQVEVEKLNEFTVSVPSTSCFSVPSQHTKKSSNEIVFF